MITQRGFRALAAAAAAGALLAAAAGAEGAIQLQHGIGGVRLGQTEAKVRAVRGAPVRVVTGSNEFGAYRRLLYRGLTVTLQGGRRVTAVSTRSPAERTNRGAGVGSTRAALLAAHPSVTCPDALHCVVGREVPGRTVTAFLLRRGAVRQVVVGYVID
jgi:hypothetical protein